MTTIDNVKEHLDLVEVVRSYNVDLKRSGERRYKALCPFHDESDPSFFVFHDSQRWHCFGCNRDGDVFDFVQEIEGWDFSTALKELAQRAGVTLRPMTPKEKAQRDYTAALGTAAAYFAQKLGESERATAYAHGRGWSDDTIELEGLGYADGTRIPDLGNGQAQQVIETLNRWAKGVGGALVYVHRERGRVVYLAGRAIKGKAHYNPPRNVAGPKRPYLNAAYAKSASELVIVEGQACAITLGDWGIPALAMGGTGIDNSLRARLQGHVNNEAIIYLIPDGDGRTDLDGLAKAADPLLGIVQLPEGVEDVNAWAKEGANKDDLKALLDNASTWLDLQIEEASQAQGVKRDRTIEALFPYLAQLEPIPQARYKEKVTSELEIGKREFNSLLKAFQDTEADREERPEILEGNYPLVAPALDFTEGLAVVTVPLLAKVDGKPMHFPYMVTSERELLDFNGDLMVEVGGRQVVLRDSPSMLGSRTRWKYTDIQAYLNGQDVNPIDVYLEAEWLLEKYIDFKEANTSDVLALWVMGTYLYPLFDAFPYVVLMGPKNSGKSKLLGLMARLAFNGRVTSNISTASLFRVVEATRGMVGIDEAERLANPRDPVAEDLRLLLNSGYKKGSPATRCQGDDHEVKEFEVYGPKVIASIGGVENVLESRCILISMLRTSGPKGGLVVSERGEDWTHARHGLYTFALQHFTGIRDLYLTGRAIEGLNNRQAELWRPLVSIAAYLDDRGAEGLLGRVQKYALRKAKDADNESLDEQRYTLLLALRDLVLDKGEEEVRAKQVVTHMNEYLDDDDKPSSSWVGYRLKEFGFCNVRHTSQGNFRVTPKDEVEDLLKRYNIPIKSK